MLKAEAMPQPTQAQIQALCASIKDALDAEQAALTVVRNSVCPTTAEKTELQFKHNAVHNRLADGADMLAAYFSGTAEQYSGGTNKPRKRES